MRWCSRGNGCGACWACFGAPGSEPGGAPTCSSEALQPASTTPSAAISASRIAAARPGAPGGDAFCRETAAGLTATPTRRSSPSVAFGDLDLLRARGFDARPVAVLHPSAHADAAVLQRLRFQAGGSEAALVAFQDRDRERLRPLPPEIHIYRACGLANRQHLAFHQREPAALGGELGRPVGGHDHIIWSAPEAKLGLARRPFPRQQLGRAGAVGGLIPDPGRNPRKSPPNHLVRGGTAAPVAQDVDIGRYPAVAVGTV